MGRLAGIVVLIAGITGLGLWAQTHQAPHIEHLVRNAAQAATATALHDVDIRVSGRDITATGIADTVAERDALIAALNHVPGRRIVHDKLTVLPVATPFTLSIGKQERSTDLTARGNVPTEAARSDLAALLGGDADALVLASGAPDGWLGLAHAAVAALAPLDFGRAEMIDGNLKVVGQARTPAEAAKVAAALAPLPGNTATTELSLLDDGSPAEWTLDYAAATGAQIAGKLPLGLDPEMLARTLGLPGVSGTAKLALLGPPANLAPLTALAPWVGHLETLHIAQRPDGTRIIAGVGRGGDPDLMAEAMREALAPTGGAITVEVQTVEPQGSAGTHRTNAASGQQEILSAGFWLPIVRVEPTVPACTAASRAVLDRSGIGFLTGSDRLDAGAQATINRLAGVMLPCARDGALRARIGGHTDAAGDRLLNLGLSQRRAVAVRQALIARGLPAASLRAQGYGDAQPIAPNDTAEGRAANRRTTIEWSN